jgi:hypothetical protein
MKTKTVTRYNCDFCDKKGYSAGHMRRHEAHCTKNPNRNCRVCTIMLGQRPTDLKELISMLPDPAPYYRENPIEDQGYYGSGLTDAINAIWTNFHFEAQECPACMMAALRQRGIPVPMADRFDFKARMKEIFDYANEKKSMVGVYPEPEF